MKYAKIILLAMVVLFLTTGTSISERLPSNAPNATGVSEVAVEVIYKEPVGKYDHVVAVFDPVTTITGSGCTVEGGTTSFNATDERFYVNGGVTLNPHQLGFNEVFEYWFSESPYIKTPGTSGTSRVFTYDWLANAGSGNTGWKVRVYFMNAGTAWNEICATSGGSIYVGSGDIIGGAGGAVSSYYTSSTTFTATNQIGWREGVTPYLHAIGKK